MKTREQKQAQIEYLANEFRQAPNIFLMSFEGLSVEKDWDLRGRLRAAPDSTITYHVVKNRLAQKAAEGTPVAHLKEQFKGMTAVALSPADPSTLAKLLTEFARENPTFRVKGAVLDGEAIPPDKIQMIANLPAKPQLLAQIMGLVNIHAQQLVNVTNGVIRNLVIVLGQIRDQKEDGQKESGA